MSFEFFFFGGCINKSRSDVLSFREDTAKVSEKNRPHEGFHLVGTNGGTV